MPNPGSYSFFGTIVVDYSYDSVTHELTVSATLSGKSMGSVVLTSANPTGQLQGTNGNNSATVGLNAHFSTRTLDLAASQTDPQKSGTGQANW